MCEANETGYEWCTYIVHDKQSIVRIVVHTYYGCSGVIDTFVTRRDKKCWTHSLFFRCLTQLCSSSNDFEFNGVAMTSATQFIDRKNGQRIYVTASGDEYRTEGLILRNSWVHCKAQGSNNLNRQYCASYAVSSADDCIYSLIVAFEPSEYSNQIHSMLHAR